MTSAKQVYDRGYTGEVETRLEYAKQLYGEFKKSLLENQILVSTLNLLRNKEATLSKQMSTMRMGSLCTQCASTEKGGCCSLFMSAETDAIQLLMNMLAGVTVEIVRTDDIGCSFLGMDGCIFFFKPMFCLNYLCHQILTGYSDIDLDQLASLTGEMLRMQYEAEKIIITEICRRRC